jgi:xanthine dehydrogenase/oxidase
MIPGTQDYETDKNLWPVNKPTTKREAIQQTSGEAVYCNDLPQFPNEVFCAFVLTKVSNGKIVNIDASKALALKGIVAFYGAKDVPGKNVMISKDSQEMLMTNDEILFAENDILYSGQPVGVIVAETHNLANEAAKLVEIEYSEPNKRKPVLSIEDALAANDKSRIQHSMNVPAQKKGENSCSTASIDINKI